MGGIAQGGRGGWATGPEVGTWPVATRKGPPLAAALLAAVD